MRLLDLNNRPVDPLQTNLNQAKVFIFVSTDCPISNRYAPEVRRLCEKFSPLGAQFWLVYPSETETSETIRKHLEDYRYPCEALRDPRHDLVKQAQVRVTPEAAVFTAGSRLVYHGRIDDRYVDFGKERPAPTRRDLHDVLEAVVSGRAVTNPPMPAVGCYIAE
ncbi:MAG: redoxin domain-containing protein [Verrucomicrobia bacterium]|nr:redoxin domain-containing protein [Verrucomicrobiota bacterium]